MSNTKEISSTFDSASNDRFEELMQKVKFAGAEIVKDQEIPLYYDLGRDELEVGKRREVEFNLNGKDFLICRDVKHRRILGSGNKKLYEELENSIIELKLKTKSELSDQWEVVDVNDLF